MTRPTGRPPARRHPQQRVPLGLAARYAPRPTGFAGWSRRRKFRLARTVGIVLLLVILLWQCTGDDDAAVTSGGPSPKTTTTAPPTTLAPKVATTATAAAVAAPLPSVRSLAGAAVTDHGVVVAGGLDQTRTSSDAVWTFDPATGATTAHGKMPTPRHSVAVVGRGDTALLLGGSKGTRVFDDVLAVDGNGKVTVAGHLPTARTDAVALRDADNGNVIVAGGWDGTTAAAEVLRSTDGLQYATVATIPTPVRFPAVAQLGRSVWIIGGETVGATAALSTAVQRVDLDTGAVAVVGQLPGGLSRASAFTLGGAVFVAGGRTADGRSDQILRLDPATGTATTAGVLPEQRSDAAIAVSGKAAYLFGGLAPNAIKTVVSITVA